MGHRLAPGRPDAEQAELGASMLGLTGDRREWRGYGLHPPALHHTRILQGEGTERRGQGKDHMTVGPLHPLACAGGEPGGLGPALALGAGPLAARVRTDLLVAPAVTRGFVAPEARRAARRVGLEPPVVGRRGHGARAGAVRVPLVPDDVGHVQGRAAHGRVSEAAGNGNSSRGLGMTARAWGLTCRARLVVRTLRCPKSSWRRRTSTPAASR
jgi:hypothetical protein